MRILPFALLLPLLFTGCLYHEVPYKIRVETDPPGARIEVDQDFMGESPVTVTVMGGHNGAWSNHQRYHIIRAVPARAGQHVQQKIFYSGWEEAGYRDTKDMIPKSIFFNMNIAPPAGKDNNVDVHLDVKAHESPK